MNLIGSCCCVKSRKERGEGCAHLNIKFPVATKRDGPHLPEMDMVPG
jgi:hypothetical protein